jgi:hypothetical protein
LLKWADRFVDLPPTWEEYSAVLPSFDPTTQGDLDRVISRALGMPLGSALRELRRFVGRRAREEARDLALQNRAEWEAVRQEARAQCMLLRCHFGNLFHPLPPRPFPAGMTGLAGEIASGDHALYPILADALEDLGEPEAAGHCREPLHGGNCHVLNWVLQRK